MPEIVRVIKYLYDHYDVKFFVTGSSSFYLKNLFPESLSGRKIIFELFPLDFEEFLIFKGFTVSFSNNFQDKSKQKNLIFYEKKKNFFEEYLHYGGFPQVVLLSDTNRKTAMLNDIFTSYFEKEVQSLADFRNITIFRDLVFLLMQKIGSKLDISKIASTLGTSRQSIYSYLSFLEKTYFVHLISPYSTNVDREISGTKKVYLCDTGFVNLFGKIDEGSLFENAVFNNLVRVGKVKYYQRRSGAEIDFILPDNKIAIEVKTKAIKQDINKLSQMSGDLKMKEYFIVSRAFVNEENVIVAVNL
jgi:predicted AAA+ superfamily ATPase